MRAIPIQRVLWRLALLAVLLLTVMPGLVRLGGHAHAGHRADGTMAAMAEGSTMPGTLAALTALRHAMPRHGDRDDDDCAYCPLLASLSLLAFVLLVPARLRMPAWRPAGRAAPPCAATRHPCGLGSRGPPLAA